MEKEDIKRRRLLIIVFFIMSNLNAQSQIKKIYSNLMGFEFEVSMDTEMAAINLENETKGEIYVVSSAQREFEYMITLVKKKEIVDMHKIEEREVYVQSYLNECSCTVEAKNLIRYNSFLSLQLKTVKKVENMELHGYVESFVINNSMYSLIYLSSDRIKSEKFKYDFNLFIKQIDSRIN